MDNPDMEDDDKKFFRIGSALDCLLTDPDRWIFDFIVVDANRPYGFMGKFIENLPIGLTTDSPKEMYQEAYDSAGYKMSIDKVIDRFWNTNEYVDYYIATRGLGDNVTVISKDEYESVMKSKELILANSYIQPYFVRTNPDHEILRQVPIYFRYKEQDCKALLDGVFIDHHNKTIQPYDLKTIGKSVYDFPISYLQFGYYRQAAFYSIALRSEQSPIKELLNAGYALLDFIFIVVESKASSSHPAIIYKTCAKDIAAGVTGGKVGRKYYKGIDELIEAYVYHLENDYWDLPKDINENRGIIQLDIFENGEKGSTEINIPGSADIGDE